MAAPPPSPAPQAAARSRTRQPWRRKRPEAPRTRSDPLHQAATRGDVAKVGWFLAHGVDVDLPTAVGETPLLLAAEAGHVAMCMCMQQSDERRA